MARYYAPDGRWLTDCGEHRTLGYAFEDGVMRCRGCMKPIAAHESIADTLARKSREAVA